MYTDPVELNKHNRDNHDDITFYEINCSMNGDPIKVDISNVSCKLCDDTIDGYVDLKIHLIKKHNHKSNLLTDDGILPFKLNLGTFKCGICNEEFTNYMKISRHFNKHYQNYVCEQCGAGFVSQGKLRTHSYTH